MDINLEKKQPIDLNRMDNTIESLETAVIGDWLDVLLEKSDRLKASDVHIMPWEKEEYRIYFRIDGLIQSYKSIHRQFAKRLISRLKLLSHIDTTQTLLPQDGQFTRMNHKEVFVDIRVATIPTIFGERASLRLLRQDFLTHFDIEALKMSKFLGRFYQNALQQTEGLILITGPTGSGKTTTLYHGLACLKQQPLHICTLEEPVEQILPGVTQISIRPKLGLNFSCALKAIMRHDPDVLMIGEIRDFETAQAAHQAAQTGHLVLSTLHTRSARSTIHRLAQFGLDTEALSHIPLWIIAQRLLRKLCDHCKKPGKALEKIVGRFTQTNLENKSHYEAVGCTQCLGQGYKGRIPVYDCLESGTVANQKGKFKLTFLHQGDSKDDRLGGIEAAAIRKVFCGLTSWKELFRVFGSSFFL